MMEINQENRFEWIDKYLENELTEDELSVFYNTLEIDESLQADLQAQQETHEQLLAHARMKAYAKGQNTPIENENMYSKEEYAHFKLIQSILKEEKEEEDDTEIEKQEGNFFKKNFKSLMAVAAMVVIGLVALWISQRNKEINTIPPIAENDTTQKQQNLVEEIIPQEDTSKEVIAEEDPDTEKIREEKKPIVKEDTNPKQFQIPEYTIMSRLGFAGKGQPNAKSRLILVYPKSPSDAIRDLSKTHYLFDDTLRFYGKNINIQELQLIYARQDQEYYLVQKVDTLKLATYEDWQLLKK